MFVAVDGAAPGLVSVADPIKASTPEAIEALHDEGLRVVMLTGDSRTTAEAVARHLGIDDVIAEVLPDQKAEVVEELQAEGAIVAMAGDGINDAPALAQAQVGIAMGTGTDVAMEQPGSPWSRATCAASCVRGVCRAPPWRNIRQNLFFAFVYNVARRPDCRGRALPVLRLAAVADDRRRGDELEFGVGDRQRAAPASCGNLTMKHSMCRFRGIY